MLATQNTIVKILALSALAHSLTALALQEKPAVSSGSGASLNPSHMNLIEQDDSMDNAANLLLRAFPNQNPVEIDVKMCNDPDLMRTFSVYDYVILLSMLVITLGIGIFYGFFQKGDSPSKTSSEMSVFPVTLSLIISFITAIELLGNPSEMFFRGTQFVLIVIPMTLVIPVAVKIFYPIYFRMELTNCYDYLGIRFSKEIRIFGTVLYVMQMVFHTAVVVQASAITLSVATGVDTKIVAVLIYVVCIVFYFFQGGMKARTIADLFQAAVLFFSLLLIVGLGCFFSGNPSQVFATVSKQKRLEFFNMGLYSTTHHTFWSVVIGGFFYWTSLFCTNQTTVQKCMSLKSLRLAKIALTFAIFAIIAVFLLNFYTGLMVVTHYVNCDPLRAGKITVMDQLLPYYVINTYSVAGIFVVGICVASLRTVAFTLHSLSAVTCKDLLVNGMNFEISPEKVTKWLSLGFGIASFGLVFIVEYLGGVLQATFTVNGVIGGVILGLFVLGIACKKANTKGAMYGGLLSLVLVICVNVVTQIFGKQKYLLSTLIDNCECYINETNIIPNWVSELIMDKEDTIWSIFRMSYMWNSMICCLVTVFLGWLISLIINFFQRRNVEITSNKAIDNPADAEGFLMSDLYSNKHQ